jgi:nitrogen fixation protein NifU and related proteins
MSDNPDRFVDGLQNQIFENTRSAYGERAFERWQNMRHMGTMENPDGYARVTGPCGDTVEVFLKFRNDRVQEVLNDHMITQRENHRRRAR